MDAEGGMVGRRPNPVLPVAIEGHRDANERACRPLAGRPTDEGSFRVTSRPQFVKTLPIRTDCPVKGLTRTARNRLAMHAPVGVPAYGARSTTAELTVP